MPLLYGTFPLYPQFGFMPQIDYCIIATRCNHFRLLPYNQCPNSVSKLFKLLTSKGQ